MQLRRLELEDQPWFPNVVRECKTDYLRFLFHTFNLYHPAIPILKTSLLPLVPVCAIWDGVISVINLYTPAELLALAQESDNKNYTWKAGKVRNRYFLRISYLVGIPVIYSKANTYEILHSE